MTNTWIQTLSGDAFDLLTPSFGEINFAEIAVILSRISRFNGHTRAPFSVAQHCVEGAHAIMRDIGRADAAAVFLLHDAHEAYIGDITSPLVAALDIRGYEMGLPPTAISSVLRSIKCGLNRAIFAAAGVPWPDIAVCKLVDEYDIRMLRTERDALMEASPQSWGTLVESMAPVQGCDLKPKSPDAAAQEWLALFNRFCGKGEQHAG